MAAHGGQVGVQVGTLGLLANLLRQRRIDRVGDGQELCRYVVGIEHSRAKAGLEFGQHSQANSVNKMTTSCEMVLYSR